MTAGRCFQLTVSIGKDCSDPGEAGDDTNTRLRRTRGQSKVIAMRKFVLAAASLAAMAMLSVMPASAQSRLALVIGNSAYTGAPPLPTTVADATSIMETLKAAGYDVTGLSDLN